MGTLHDGQGERVGLNNYATSLKHVTRKSLSNVRQTGYLSNRPCQVYQGGSSATVLVPLDELAMFKRSDAKSPFVLSAAADSR